MAEADSDYRLVVVGHGSRDPEGVAEFEALARRVRERSDAEAFSYGFLEFAAPTIDEAVESVLSSGARHIAVVPAMLLAAAHAKNDIPVEVLSLRQRHPELSIHYAAPMHLHPSVLKGCRQRIIEGEGRSDGTVKRSETCLVVVGRGTTDPDANADVFKLARLLQEGMGFGGSYVCYSGTARPLVAEGLQEATKLGYRRLIVFPFFLLTGVLVKRIHAAADEVQTLHPDIEILKADYLGVSDDVVTALLERARESVAGKAVMNCTQCKYRAQVIGYEEEVGKPQEGHHFHVRAGGMAPQSGRNNEPGTRGVPGVEAGRAIEQQSWDIIESLRDWSVFPETHRSVLKRLVHTTGDVAVADEIYFSPGSVVAGINALARRAPIITDVTMVQSGLRRELLKALNVTAACLVHDEETYLMADSYGLTRSAAGIRRAWDRWGNDVVLAIGDAPTAVEEALTLISEQNWRPALIVGLPVGWVGTTECKRKLRRCLRVPRITNEGTKGGSPWAASVINTLIFMAYEREVGEASAETKKWVEISENQSG